MKNLYKEQVTFKAIMVIVIAFLLQACVYKCPGFSDDNIGWIPYTEGNSLHYTDGENVMEFEVIDFYKNPPSSFRGLTMDYWCGEEGYYRTNKVSFYYINERYSYGMGNGYGMKVQITDDDVFLFDIWSANANIEELTTKTDSMEIRFRSDTIIGNQKYNNVFKISKTKMKDSERISWIIKAKDKGIVQFYDRKSEKTWTLH